jgi:hypothetical protein
MNGERNVSITPLSSSVQLKLVPSVGLEEIGFGSSKEKKNKAPGALNGLIVGVRGMPTGYKLGGSLDWRCDAKKRKRPNGSGYDDA